MSIYVTAGWWLAPATATFIFFAAAFWFGRPEGKGGGDYSFAPFFDALMLGVFLLVALVASLASWLIWALLGAAS